MKCSACLRELFNGIGMTITHRVFVPTRIDQIFDLCEECGLVQCDELLAKGWIQRPPEETKVPDVTRHRCDDCNLDQKSDDLIHKGDHHGGLKWVCKDRGACHHRTGT